jgi:hypothetical protein
MNCEGDVVLIHHQDRPAMYARIEAIEQDIKKDWYRVTLLLLTIPQQVMTWILREEYINGVPFTMDGNSVMLEKVEKISLKQKAQGVDDEIGLNNNGKSGKVIPFKSGSE